MQVLTDLQRFWNLILNEKSPYWPVVCVDFNGVLDKHQGWNGKVEYTEPADGVIEFLQRLDSRFRTIVLFTATIPIEGVVEWLEEWALDSYIDFVTNLKVPAAVYIDDKAVVHNGDFNDTIRRIDEFKVWWKQDDRR